MSNNSQAQGDRVFDRPNSIRINEARFGVLEPYLKDWVGRYGLKTALDAGCGLGWFSAKLSGLGLKVTAFDGREGNVTEARARLPQVDFRQGDVEDGAVASLGSFDFVLCFGLLYHLENPFTAIRNLRRLTGKMMFIESIVAPDAAPIAQLVSECSTDDQGLRYVALIPSESCFVEMLRMAGFSHVYKPSVMPDHEEFRGRFLRRSRRTMLVASMMPLESQSLTLLAKAST